MLKKKSIKHLMQGVVILVILLSTFAISGCFPGKHYSVRIEGNDNILVTQPSLTAPAGGQDFAADYKGELNLPLGGLLSNDAIPKRNRLQLVSDEKQDTWQDYAARLKNSLLPDGDKTYWLRLLKNTLRAINKSGAGVVPSIIVIKADGHNWSNGQEEAN